jgi:hypothetical protein|tara:strand:- start:2756 stop:3220 length:465 start_codon:yes stop_codon:yes gene_type:complete
MKHVKEYNVEMGDGDTIIFTETTISYADVNEAIALTNNIINTKMKNDQQLEAMKKAQKDNQIEIDIADLEKKSDEFHNLKVDFDNALKPHFDKVETEIRQFVKTKKAEIGYDRISDTNLKIVRTAETLAEIANKLGLDVAHPVIKKVKVDFDSI